MKRALLLLLLLCGCHRKSAIDAGVPLTETPPDPAPAVVKLEPIDARITPDAGEEQADAAVPDAGKADAAVPDAGAATAVSDAGPVEVAEVERDAVWLAYDGGPGDSSGVTDRVNLKVGATIRVSLPLNIGVMCDDLGVVDVKPLQAGYELTGKAPGVTHCRFNRQSTLERYFEIAVRP